MPLLTKVGSFQKPNGAAVSQAITGVGFTPKVVVFWFSGGQTSGTWKAHTFQGVGYTAGPTNSFAMSTTSRDAVATASAQRRIVAKAITQVDFNGGLHEADLASFNTDGFTLNWGTDGSGVGLEVNYLALGGSDITGAKVVNWTTPTATGNKAVTGVGFSPDLVLHGFTAQGTLATAASAVLTTGAMNKAGQQWVNAIASSDAISPSDTSRWQRTDACLGYIGGSEALSQRAAYVSMDADGFTTNWTTVDGTAKQVVSLCLKGVVSKLGVFAKTTAAAPAAQSITGVGFQAKALLFSNIQSISATTPVSTAAFTLGAWDGTTSRLVALRDQDAANPTQVDALFHSDRLLLGDSTAGNPPTSNSLASGTSLDSDGFTLTWNPNNATAIESLYLAIGQVNVAPNAPTLVAPANNAIFDRATTQRFDWDFHDPDTGDSQSKYDLQYRLTSDTAWATVTGTTPNTHHDFLANTFAAGDYEWQVRTYDSQGFVGPWSSSSFFTAANAPAAPTITDPVNGGTVNSDPYIVQWSYPTQGAYQVRTLGDDAGSPNLFVVYTDTGVVESTTVRSRSVAFPTQDRYEHVQVRIRDSSSGLWSPYASVRILVSYTRPAVPALTATGASATASISVALDPGPWPVTLSAVAYTGTGTGTMTGPTATPGITDAHSWAVTLVTAAADGGTFDVAKDGVVVGQAVVGTQFTHEGLSFTINDGATDFAVGDKFTFSTTAVKTTSHDVHRRVASSGAGIRVAAALPISSTWVDYRPASGVNYEYRVVSYGDNGTTSTSDWQG